MEKNNMLEPYYELSEHETFLLDAYNVLQKQKLMFEEHGEKGLAEELDLTLDMLYYRLFL